MFNVYFQITYILHWILIHVLQACRAASEELTRVANRAEAWLPGPKTLISLVSRGRGPRNCPLHARDYIISDGYPLHPTHGV